MTQDFLKVSTTQAPNATQTNKEMAQIRGQVKKLLFDKLYDSRRKGETLSKKEIREGLNISKSEAKAIYKELNIDGKRGISEWDIWMHGIREEIEEHAKKMLGDPSQESKEIKYGL